MKKILTSGKRGIANLVEVIRNGFSLFAFEWFLFRVSLFSLFECVIYLDLMMPCTFDCKVVPRLSCCVVILSNALPAIINFDAWDMVQTRNVSCV